MIVIFEHEYLKALYEDGKSPDKKHPPASVLNEVLNGKRAVTTEYALL